MSSDVRCTSDKNVWYGRWWWTRFPHTWRNHPAWSPHPCRTSHQAPFLLTSTHTNFLRNRIFNEFLFVCFDGATQEHNWDTRHWSTKTSQQPNGPLSLTMQYIHSSINSLYAWMVRNSFTFSLCWFTPIDTKSFGQHDQIFEFMAFLAPTISNDVYSKKGHCVTPRWDGWCLYKWNSIWTGFLPAIIQFQWLRVINKEEVSDRVWPAWYASICTFKFHSDMGKIANFVVQYCLLFLSWFVICNFITIT